MSFKNVLPYRDQPPCENKHCQVLQQELTALKAKPKPTYRLAWRTLNNSSYPNGRDVALISSLLIFLLTALACLIAVLKPGGQLPATNLILMVWPGVPFVVMLHMLKIVKL